MWWIFWLVLAGLLGVAEFFTLTLAFGLLAGAALVASIVAGLGRRSPSSFSPSPSLVASA